MHIWEDCKISQSWTMCVEFQCILNMTLKDFSLDEEFFFFFKCFSIVKCNIRCIAICKNYRAQKEVSGHVICYM